MNVATVSNQHHNSWKCAFNRTEITPERHRGDRRACTSDLFLYKLFPVDNLSVKVISEASACFVSSLWNSAAAHKTGVYLGSRFKLRRALILTVWMTFLIHSWVFRCQFFCSCHSCKMASGVFKSTTPMVAVVQRFTRKGAECKICNKKIVFINMLCTYVIAWKYFSSV